MKEVEKSFTIFENKRLQIPTGAEPYSYLFRIEHSSLINGKVIAKGGPLDITINDLIGE